MNVVQNVHVCVKCGIAPPLSIYPHARGVSTNAVCNVPSVIIISFSFSRFSIITREYVHSANLLDI